MSAEQLDHLSALAEGMTPDELDELLSAAEAILADELLDLDVATGREERFDAEVSRGEHG